MNGFAKLVSLIGTDKDIGRELQIYELKNYKIISKIGKGGFGEVYKIKSIGAHNSYALKVIKLDEYNKPKFEKEKIIYDKFSIKKKVIYDSSSSYVECTHYNINCYFLIFSARIGKVTYGFIITSYYDADLRFIMMNGPPYSLSILENRNNILTYIKWVKELGDTITYIHRENIAHGDIKPENILVSYKRDSVALTDFDTVCFNNQNGTCYITDISPLYASPQLYDSILKSVDHIVVRITDIWALSIIILELWFGAEQLRKLLNFDIPHTWYESEDINHRLDMIILELNNIYGDSYLDNDRKILYDLLSASVRILKIINGNSCSAIDIINYLDLLDGLRVIDYNKKYEKYKRKYEKLKNLSKTL